MVGCITSTFDKSRQYHEMVQVVFYSIPYTTCNLKQRKRRPDFTNKCHWWNNKIINFIIPRPLSTKYWYSLRERISITTWKVIKILSHHTTHLYEVGFFLYTFTKINYHNWVHAKTNRSILLFFFINTDMKTLVKI